MARPNFLLIMTDQQRGDCLGVEGHPVLMTPNMDSIATSGVRFTRAYTPCPSCIAARRSLMSGQEPATHGLVGYRDGLEWEAPPTLPGVLRQQGYQTQLVGRSMHLHPPRKRYGFDAMDTAFHTGQNDYDNWLAQVGPQDNGGWLGGGVMHNDWTARPWAMEDHLHFTNWTVDRALSFLERRDPSCPFFLVVSFMAPHPPLQPPAFYMERYLRTGVPKPVIGDWAERPAHDGLGVKVDSHNVNLTGEALLSARAAYYGLINHVDDQIRRLLNTIRNTWIANTVVMLTSDHGEMLGDHYCWRKTVPYEPSARIPLLVSAPAKLGLGCDITVDAPVALQDIMPTVLELADAPVPSSVDGRSLVPLLRGEKPSWREFLHIEHSPMHQSLTDGKQKYIWFVADGREQLFDLTADPTECHDLVRDAQWAGQLNLWRSRLMARLKDRPEGFTDGQKLIPGRTYRALVQWPEDKR